MKEKYKNGAVIGKNVRICDDFLKRWIVLSLVTSEKEK